MAAKRLRYAFIGDAESLLRSINKSETALGKFGRSVGAVGKMAVSGFAVIGAAAAVAGVKAVNVASDANEAAAAFDTTFGGAAVSAGKFVEEFANKAGLAEHELKQLLATSGAVLQGINFTADGSADLSTKLATLAGDVASFSNVQGGAQPVMEAFTKALLGERESLKTYGIAIMEADVQQQAFIMTGKASASELTKQEKALATYELLLQKTTVQQGDLNRTQDGFANASRKAKAELRDLQAELGEELLPVATELIPVFSNVVKALAEGLAPTIKEIAPVIQRLADLFNVLAPVLLPLLEKGFHILAKSLDLIVIGAEGAVSVYEALTGETGELNSFTHDYIGTNKDLTKGLENTSFATKELTGRQKALEIQSKRAIAQGEFYLQQHKDRIKASNDLQGEMISEDDRISDLIRSHQANTAAMREEAEAIQKDLIPNLSDLQSAKNAIIAIQDREAAATKALKRAKDELIDANRDLLDIDENIAMANDDLADANLDVKKKEEALNKAKEKAKEVTDEERLAILRQTEAVQRLTDEQDGSEIKTLELALATKELNKLRADSVGNDRNVIDAERELQKAQQTAENTQQRINDLLERKEKLREREIELAETVKEKQDDLNDVSTNNIDVMLKLAEAQDKYNKALEKLTDGKYEDALAKIANLAGQAMGVLSGEGTTTTPTITIPKAVKKVAEVAKQTSLNDTFDSGRASATINGMGGASRFGEVTVNFNGNVTNPQEVTALVQQGIKGAEKKEGTIDRVISGGGGAGLKFL